MDGVINVNNNLYLKKQRAETLSIIWWYEVKVSGNSGEKESQGAHRGPQDLPSSVH